MALELPLHGSKGVSDGDMGIRVRCVFIRRTAGDDVLARHAQLDPDRVEASLLVPVLRFDDHMTAHDAIEDRFELVDAVPDLGIEGRVRRNLMEGDLKRGLHGLVWCEARARPAVPPVSRIASRGVQALRPFSARARNLRPDLTARRGVAAVPRPP